MPMSLLLRYLAFFFPAVSRSKSLAPQHVTSVKAADAVCAQCHEAIYSSYLQTPMANASGLAASHLTPGTFHDKLSRIDYTLQSNHGEATLVWHDLRHPPATGQTDLRYFLGSGHLGTTWLYEKNQYWFESPVAWYTTSHRYDMKPGMTGVTQMLPALPMENTCMRCHMSAVQPTVPGTLNEYAGLPFLHGGITCESCHGDTREHVVSGGKAPVVNPAHLDPEARDSVCISCHLEGDVTVERVGHSVLNYRPGDPISRYLAYYVFAKADPLARGVSEVEQFNQSMCKRMSGDKMSCTTCHDPHFDPSPSQKVAYYRSKCLTCHNAPAFLKTHHPDNPNCIGCHMPHNGSQNIPHVAWTDHRILARPTPENTADSTATNVLKPIFSPRANRRDLGMAYYLAYVRGNQAEGDKAWKLLSSQQQAIQNDKAAPDALGLLSIEHGDYASGQADFERALKLDATDLTALSNLGVMMAKEGKLTKSVQDLGQAFNRNPDEAGLAMNLARIECAMGNVSGVHSTLHTALDYNPDVRALESFLNSAGECRASSGAGKSQ